VPKDKKIPHSFAPGSGWIFDIASFIESVFFKFSTSWQSTKPMKKFFLNKE